MLSEANLAQIDLSEYEEEETVVRGEAVSVIGRGQMCLRRAVDEKEFVVDGFGDGPWGVWGR